MLACARLGAITRANMKVNERAVSNEHFGRGVLQHNPQAVAASQKIMSLTGNHFAFRLARLRFEPGLLTFDPTEFAGNGQSDGVICDSKRNGDADTAIGRVNTKVQVLNSFADNLNRQAIDHDLAAFNTHFDSLPDSWFHRQVPRSCRRAWESVTSRLDPTRVTRSLSSIHRNRSG